MKSLHATSMLILGASAVRINPLNYVNSADQDVPHTEPDTPSPNYLDWFEHPTYNDQDYADYYTRDVNNAIQAADVISDETQGREPEYLENNPLHQYWVENWYVDSSMPIRPHINWDEPTNVNLTPDQKAWRQNKWLDRAATTSNEQLTLLKGKYQELLKKLEEIESENNVGRKLYTGGVKNAATWDTIPRADREDYQLQNENAAGRKAFRDYQKTDY